MTILNDKTSIRCLTNKLFFVQHHADEIQKDIDGLKVDPNDVKN